MSENARRAAIVTGGSRGIGRAIATALGALGFGVVINYNRSADAAEDAGRDVVARGGEAEVVQADVSSLDDHAKLIDAAVRRFGRIDLLVNNAGVAPDVRADLLEATPESYDRVMGINLRGPYFLTQAVANAMIKQIGDGTIPRADIVNIGSVSAYAASTFRGEYCLSKAGMAMMTMLFADRLADEGINVYEVRPGVIATDMTGPVKAKYDKLIDEGLTPIRRWGRPEDVAAAVVAVAEGRLPFSTGQILDVDGGFHFRRL